MTVVQTRDTLTRRGTIVAALVVAITVIVTGATGYRAARFLLIDQIHSRLAADADHVQATLSTGSPLAIDQPKRAIAASSDAALRGRYQVLSGSTAAAGSRIGDDFIEVSRPLSIEEVGPDAGRVLIAHYPRAHVYAPIDSLRRTVERGALFVIAISALFLSWVARELARPLLTLRDAAVAITPGDRRARVGIRGKGEVGQLSEAFDEMLDELDRAQRELEQRVADRTAALHQANAELVRSNSELDQFAYVAAHDLRAPLRAIENLAKWIDEDAGDRLTDASRKDLSLLQRRARRLKQLLDDLLEYSRIGRFRTEDTWLDVGRAIDDVVLMQGPPKAFDIRIAPSLPRVRAPAGTLQLIFGNLLRNAIQHHDRESGSIEFQCRDLGSCFEFAVDDDGPGIQADVRDRVFEMFQTLRPCDESNGSGMGLALVRKIVEARGGRAWAAPGADGGTSLRFTWPKDSTAHSEEIVREEARVLENGGTS